jgi:hypothetical protein
VIKFDSKEDAIEVAIQVFDKLGSITIGEVEICDGDVIIGIEEDANAVRWIINTLYHEHNDVIFECFEQARIRVKIKLITEAVNEWWSKQ